MSRRFDVVRFMVQFLQATQQESERWCMGVEMDKRSKQGWTWSFLCLTLSTDSFIMLVHSTFTITDHNNDNLCRLNEVERGGLSVCCLGLLGFITLCDDDEKRRSMRCWSLSLRPRSRLRKTKLTKAMPTKDPHPLCGLVHFLFNGVNGCVDTFHPNQSGVAAASAWLASSLPPRKSFVLATAVLRRDRTQHTRLPSSACRDDV